jgi:hypothetical protein
VSLRVMYDPVARLTVHEVEVPVSLASMVSRAAAETWPPGMAALKSQYGTGNMEQGNREGKQGRETTDGMKIMVFEDEKHATTIRRTG